MTLQVAFVTGGVATKRAPVVLYAIMDRLVA